MGITLIVAYDIARLHMLDGLCASWGGHISAAVYQVHRWCCRLPKATNAWHA